MGNDHCDRDNINCCGGGGGGGNGGGGGGTGGGEGSGGGGGGNGGGGNGGGGTGDGNTCDLLHYIFGAPIGTGCMGDGGGGDNGGGGGGNGGGGDTCVCIQSLSGEGCCCGGGGEGGGNGGGGVTLQFSPTAPRNPLMFRPPPGGSCPPPPGGPSPAAVPGPDSAFTTLVTVVGNLFENAMGLPVTCAETGVTQTSDCGSLSFFFGAGFTFGQTAHYATPGGGGTRCNNMQAHAYAAGSVTKGVGMSTAILHVGDA